MVKKILIVVICLAFVPMLFAYQANRQQANADADINNTGTQTTLTVESGQSQRTMFHGKPHPRPTSRDLLWDQAATQYNSLAACQWDSTFAFDPEFCDNFTLAADATIDSVVWWGGYWNGSPSPPLDIWIKIYPDSGGGLGPQQTAIYAERVGYTETFIDSLSGVYYYYYYTATIPSFNATGGVTYYITFQPTLIYPPQSGLNVAEGLWGDGNQGYFKSAYFGFPNWLPAFDVFGLQYESAFQLYGTSGGGGSTGGPDDFGYTWIDSEAPGGPTFNWIDISGTGTPTFAGDDDEIWPIPFTFTFYGMTFDTIGISSNGAIYFEDLSYWPLSNYSLPYGTYTNQFIALYWDDLNPASTNSDDIYWEVIGNQLVIQWNNIVHYGTSDTLMAELILDGSTGEILMQYLDASSEAGSGATVGIQGDTTVTPAWYLEFLYNSPDLQDNYAILFSPPGAALSILYVDDDEDAGISGYFETSFNNLGYAFDMWVVTDSGGVTPTAAQMGGYDAVVWTTGEDYSSTFVGNDTVEIANYLNAGGRMWLSSQDVLWDLGAVGFLHVGSFVSDIGCSQATGIGPITTPITFPTTGGIIYDYSDEVQPDGVTWAEMQNETNTNNTIAMNAPYYLFFNAFGFENINNVADRDTMMARILDWIGAPPPDHDVGCTQVLSPPSPMAGPADYDVIGRIQNFGSGMETFDVTANVYEGMTQIFTNTVTLTDFPAGGDSAVNFGTVTFVGGNTYDTEIYTELAGDINPSNDTATASTFCTSIYWEVLANMPSTRSGPFAGYAYINDTVYIHVFGGNPTASQTTHDIYNTETGTWSSGTPLPYPMNYGGHCSINNRIYLVGSFVAASNPYMTIYDAESDVYTSVNLPVPVNDPGIAVVDDNLIYIIGGGLNVGWNPSNTVQLYDVAGDSFFTGVTQLPNTIMAGAAGYLGNDTIIHAAGMQASGNYVNTTYLGYIDPGNPANITWTLGPDKPGTGNYRLNGDAADGTMFVAGGGAPYTAETYAYESGTGWLTLPDKPAAHSNWGCAMAPLYSANEWIMYAAGGYTGSYHDFFHALHTGIPATAIAEHPGEVPMAFGFRLLSSNPATERVQFQFDMPVQGAVNFSVYDIVGRRVLDNDYSNISAGTHTMIWDRVDSRGRKVANGIYFYRLEAVGNVATGKLILVQ